MKLSNTWIREMSDQARGTYWFLPLGMSLLAVLLALLASHIDLTIPAPVLARIWIIPSNIDPASARSSMTTLATSELGIIGVVFSITLVPLTIATSQFGSILLRVFLRNLGTQIVLGTYSASIIYNLAIIWILSHGEYQSITPAVSVMIGFVLFVIDLALLIAFFQLIANLLQASNIIAFLGSELEKSIEQDILPGSPGGSGTNPEESLLQENGSSPEQIIRATRHGYVHAINYDYLMSIAEEKTQVFRVTCEAGTFLNTDDPLIRARPGGMDARTIGSLQRSFFMGRYRTMLQDSQFGISQLVNIASRALSPAVNDPATPLMVLNQLEVTLGLIARKGDPSCYRYGRNGELRMVVQKDTFAQFADNSFNLIRDYGRESPDVLVAMLTSISRIATRIRTDDQRQVLLHHAHLIKEVMPVGISWEYDRQRVLRAYEHAVDTLNPPAPQLV